MRACLDEVQRSTSKVSDYVLSIIKRILQQKVRTGDFCHTKSLFFELVDLCAVYSFISFVKKLSDPVLHTLKVTNEPPVTEKHSDILVQSQK
jgi:hypothetical protein